MKPNSIFHWFHEQFTLALLNKLVREVECKASSADSNVNKTNSDRNESERINVSTSQPKSLLKVLS